MSDIHTPLIDKYPRIYHAEEQLSPVNIDFFDFIETNRAALDRSQFNHLLENSSDAFGLVQPWPVFIDSAAGNRMKEAALEVFDLVRSIPDRIFSYDTRKMSHFYEVPEVDIEFQLEGTDETFLKSLLGRADFILGPSGLKCLEFNVSAGIGGWQTALLKPLYLQTPVISRFLREYGVKIRHRNLFEDLLEHIVPPAVKKFNSIYTDEINFAVVIVEFDGVAEAFRPIEASINNVYKQILDREYDGLRGNIILCDFHHLTVSDNRLFHKNKRVHVVLEMYHGDVPGHVLEVFRAGKLMLYNGPITALLVNKLNLALLSEHEDSDIFNSREREAIKRYIPWTRKIVPGLEDFILSNREKLVIKPSDGYGGESVFIGCSVSDDLWKEAVMFAQRNKNWLVQEYVDSDSYLLQNGECGCCPHHAVWGLFVFGSRYAGGFLRVSPGENNTGVINTHAGSEKTVVLELEE